MDQRVWQLPDLQYVCTNFYTLAELCVHGGRDLRVARDAIVAGRAARASYVLIDGEERFPRDYFRQVFARDAFESRYAAEAARLGASAADAYDSWCAAMEGTYGVCLNEVTPENIIRKGCLIEDIARLVAAPEDANPLWQQALREAVAALDRLERPFCAFDRERFGRSVSRDTSITDVQARFPDVFVNAPTSVVASEPLRA